MASEPVGAAANLVADAAAQAAPVRPTSAAERIPALDVLRGIAILGVLASYTLWNLGAPPAETWTVLDRIINTAGDLLIDTKFLTLFAFLFGVGNAQQWRRAELNQQDPVPRHLRRMLFLLFVGLLNGALLRNGDILAPYAILGFVLLASRQFSNRVLVVAAIVLAVLPYAIQVIMHLGDWSLVPRPGPEAENLDWLRYWYLTNPLISWPRILALMLAGVLALRAGLIDAVAVNRDLARRILLVAIPTAIATRILLQLTAANWQPPPGTLAKSFVMNFGWHLSAWALAAGYASGIALLCRSETWVKRLGSLRATGRMAFTNYLMQGLIVVPICLAFGLYDAVTPTIGLSLALLVAAVQIPFSMWWLRRHDYGPLEWVWRRTTYGGLTPARTK